MNRVHKSKVRPPDFRNLHRNVYSYFPPARSSDPNHHPLNVLSAVRLRRAPGGDKLDDVIEKMEAIARIANGISLEIGLIDQTIAADVIIPELLHMGTLTFDDVANMNYSNLKTALSKMNVLSASLDGFTADDTIFLTRYFVLEGAREKFAAIGDIGTTLPGKQEYVGKLEQVETDKLMTTDMGVLTENDAMVLRGLVLSASRMKSDTDDTAHVADLAQLKRIFFDNVINNMNMTSLDKLNNIAKLKNGAASIKVLLDEQKLNSEVDSSTRLLIGNTKMPNHLGALKDAATELQASQSSFENIKTLVTARHGLEKLVYSNSAGFSNGAKDLEKLHNDVGNDWIKKVMKHEENFANLKAALMAMESFRRDVEAIENDWGQSIQPSAVNAVTSIHKTQLDVADPTYSADTHQQVFAGYEACDLSFDSARAIAFDATALTAAETSLNTLNTKLKALEELDYQNGLTVLQGLKAKVEEVTAADQMKAFVTDWKANDRGAEAVKFLEQLEKNLKVVEKLDNAFYTELGNVKNNVNALDGYLTSLDNSKYVTLFNCLKNVANREAGRKKMDVIQRIKNTGKNKNDNIIGEVTKVVQAAEDSVGKLKKAKSSGEEMKNVPVREAKVLKESSPKAAEISQKLGLAVQGLQMIRKVGKQKSSLDALSDVSSITTSASTNQSQLTPETISSLQKLSALGNDLNKMFGDIDNFRGALKELKDTSLADNQDIFTNAAAIQSVLVNAEEMKKAVEALAKIDTNLQAGAVITALDVLETLNLNFASYQFGEAKQSLTELDTFFVTFYQNLASTPAPTLLSGDPESSSSRGIPQPNSEASATGKNEDSGVPGYTWGLVGGGLLLLLAAAGVGGYYVKKTWFTEKPSSIEKDEDALQIQLKSRTRCKLRDPKVTEDDDSLMRALLIYVQTARDDPLKGQQSPKGWITKIKAANDAQSQLEISSIDGLKLTTRNPVPCKEATVVKVPELVGRAEYHGSILSVDDERKWIMAHSPVGNERSGRANLWDTRYKFYCVLNDYKVGVVVQLCKFRENGVTTCATFHSDIPNGVEKYLDSTGSYVKTTTVEKMDISKHFPGDKEKQFSCFKVDYETKFEDKEKDSDGNPRKGKNRHGTVIVLRYNGWEHKKCPVSTKVAIDIIKFADSFKTNVMVISSTGLGRAGTLTTIKKGIEMCLMGDANSFQQIISEVRNARIFAMDTAAQFMYSFVAIFHGVCEIAGIKHFPCGFQFEYFNEKLQSGELDALTGPDGNFATNKQSCIFYDETRKYARTKDDEYKAKKEAKIRAEKEANGEAAKERAAQARNDELQKPANDYFSPADMLEKEDEV